MVRVYIRTMQVMGRVVCKSEIVAHASWSWRVGIACLPWRLHVLGWMHGSRATSLAMSRNGTEMSGFFIIYFVFQQDRLILCRTQCLTRLSFFFSVLNVVDNRAVEPRANISVSGIQRTPLTRLQICSQTLEVFWIPDGGFNSLGSINLVGFAAEITLVYKNERCCASLTRAPGSRQFGEGCPRHLPGARAALIQINRCSFSFTPSRTRLGFSSGPWAECLLRDPQGGVRGETHSKYLKPRINVRIKLV